MSTLVDSNPVFTHALHAMHVLGQKFTCTSLQCHECWLAVNITP